MYSGRETSQFLVTFFTTDYRLSRESAFVLAELLIPNLKGSLPPKDTALQFPVLDGSW